MNKYTRLVNNSFLFAIGNIGSKLINILMVPLYTYKLNTSQYGTVDLMLTTINLLIPILTMEIGSAVIRYTIDAKDDLEKRKIYSNSIVYLLLLLFLLIVISPILYYFDIYQNYLFLFLLLLVSMVFNNVLAQFIRGIEKVKEYAFNGILQTIVTVICNLIFLVKFDMNINGYLLSMIIAAMISNIFLIIQSRDYFIFNFLQLLDYNLFKNMTKFSVPLIPNTIMWWIINGATRYLILFFIDSSANGLYAVANKIPTIISTMGTIFIQAWQLSAFEEYKNEDRDKFNSIIFDIYSTVLFLVGSAILVILIPVMKFLVSSDFFSSWKLVPFLILAVIYQSLSGFLGVNYTAAMDTRRAFSTSVYGGGISIIANILLIPSIGLIGATIGSFISFFAMFLFRLKDTKDLLDLNYNKKIFIISNGIYLLQTFLLFFIVESKFSFIVQLILLFINFILNIKLLLQLAKSFWS